MPAAAVIPAPIAYINVVAVKKLVVGFLVWRARAAALLWLWCSVHSDHPSRRASQVFIDSGMGSRSFTLKKLECSKQADAMNTLAWNNEVGLWSYFVGF